MAGKVVQVGERKEVSSRKHWSGYDVRIRSTSRTVFFLKLSCLSGCFDRILLWSASSGYHTLSEGTLRIPARILSIFRLCLAGTSLYQRCRFSKGILRVPNRRRSRYPHAGRQNAVYCQTLERLLIIKERKILPVEVPDSCIQACRCFWEETSKSLSPTYCTNLTRCLHISTKKNVTFSQV